MDELAYSDALWMQRYQALNKIAKDFTDLVMSGIELPDSGVALYFEVLAEMDRMNEDDDRPV